MQSPTAICFFASGFTLMSGNTGGSVRYRRVARDEDNEAEDKKKAQSDRIERFTAKLHALFWVCLSIFVVYYTELLEVALYGEKVDRLSLNLAIISTMITTTIILYLTFWLPLVLKVTIPWEVYCPRMIPAATFFGILSFILYLFAFWPRFGLLTPLITITISMGLLFSTHFVPWPC